jgi:hypothetical protein
MKRVPIVRDDFHPTLINKFYTDEYSGKEITVNEIDFGKSGLKRLNKILLIN